MDVNLPQKAAQETGAGNAGISVEYRKEGTPAVEKKRGNFRSRFAEMPYMALPETEEAGRSGNAEAFPFP
jgi:hypothetical protein